VFDKKADGEWKIDGTMRLLWSRSASEDVVRQLIGNDNDSRQISGKNYDQHFVWNILTFLQ